MTRLNGVLGIMAATLGGGAAISDLVSVPHPTELATEIETGRDHISAIDLAEWLMKGDRTLSIFDLRPRAAFEQLHVPGARNATVTEISDMGIDRKSTVVLYSEGGAHAGQAWVLLRMRGYRKVFFLREGVYEWVSRVVDPRLASDATEAERTEFVRAAELSRYFGGTPLAGVSRSEVPTGYWTGLPPDAELSSSGKQQSLAVRRRRGC